MPSALHSTRPVPARAQHVPCGSKICRAAQPYSGSFDARHRCKSACVERNSNRDGTHAARCCHVMSAPADGTGLAIARVQARALVGTTRWPWLAFRPSHDAASPIHASQPANLHQGPLASHSCACHRASCRAFGTTRHFYALHPIVANHMPDLRTDCITMALNDLVYKRLRRKSDG